MSKSVSEVLDHLAGLTDLRSEMEERGIKGVPSSAHACVISNYVRQETGQTVSTVPGALYVREYLGEDHDYEIITYDLPLNVAAFANLFDDGAYPELER